MADINVKRFVDVNISANVVHSVSTTRDTIVLFTEEGTASTTNLFSSYKEAQTTLDSSTFATTLAYLKVYFDNGGVKCMVVQGVTFASLTKDDILAFDNKYIIFAFAYTTAQLSTGYSAISALATSLASDTSVYGINEKILLARNTTIPDPAPSITNFIVKYSSVLAAEMTIASYLSQIDISGTNVVNDYAFTQETITSEDITDSLFGNILEANFNVDITLAGASRNMGGNCTDGSDITNNYVRILLHQTLTDRLIALLTTKLKDNRGISQIYSAIAQELEIYKNAGYLSTDKIWTNPDLTISYNNKTYNIISQGTALTTGYSITILPLSSLTDADKAARKVPPIYVIIADQYGIRQITINGEVI